MENTLFRSAPCPSCGSGMLWTQNAWQQGDFASAAYRCPNGHVLDPGTTRQCPVCGEHDTEVVGHAGETQHFRCLRCGNAFVYPR